MEVGLAKTVRCLINLLKSKPMDDKTLIKTIQIVFALIPFFIAALCLITKPDLDDTETFGFWLAIVLLLIVGISCLVKVLKSSK